MDIDHIVNLIVDGRSAGVAGRNAAVMNGTAEEALENLLETIRDEVAQINNADESEKLAGLDLSVLCAVKPGQLEREQIKDILIAINAGKNREVLRAAGQLNSKTEAHRPRETQQGNRPAVPAGKSNRRVVAYVVVIAIAIAIALAVWLVVTQGPPWGRSSVDNAPAPPAQDSSVPSAVPPTRQEPSPGPAPPVTKPAGATKGSAQSTPVAPERRPTLRADGTYRISTPVNGGCLGYRGDYPLTIQKFCDGAQSYRVAPFDGGYRVLDAGRTDYCLGPDDGRTVRADSATTRVACNDPALRQGLVWDIEPVPGGYHRIRNRLNSGMCLTAKADGPADAGKPAPRFYECARQDLQERQRWLFREIPSPPDP